MLVDAARRRLRVAKSRHQDAEDVAQIAFISFYQTLRRTGLPQVTSRHQLLALLTHIVACRAINEAKRSLTQKRGGGNVKNDSPLLMLSEAAENSPLEEALLKDCYTFYINSLPEKLRPTAELHLAGFANREIAERLQCVERTVERKLSLLRQHWQTLAVDSVNADVTELLNS